MPLHNVYLKSNLIIGPVVVGVIPSLPVRKVTLTLRSNLAGGKVVVNPAYLVVLSFFNHKEYVGHPSGTTFSVLYPILMFDGLVLPTPL